MIDYTTDLEMSAAFIAHARQDVPDLVAEVERLTAYAKAQNISHDEMLVEHAAEIATLEYMIGERDAGWALANKEVERLTAENKSLLTELAGEKSEAANQERWADHYFELWLCGNGFDLGWMPTPADDARLEAALDTGPADLSADPYEAAK